MKRKNIVSLIMLLLLMGVLAACTSSGGVFEVSSALAEDDSAPGYVRQIALSILDQSDYRDYIQFVDIPCTNADGLGGPPKCDAGMAEGTIVEVFPVLGGEGYYYTPENIDTYLNLWVKDLYAVYKISPNQYQEPYWPAGEYALLFDRDENDIPFPITVYVESGKIVRLIYHLGVRVEDQLLGIPVEQIMIPPAEVENWLYPDGK
jgi:hypothetical protein